MVEKPKDKPAYEKAKGILEDYISSHPDGNIPYAEMEIARIDELLGDPIAMLERYLNLIRQKGNDPFSQGLGNTMNLYLQKYRLYSSRYSDTVRFLRKLDENKSWRTRVLNDKTELLNELPNFQNMSVSIRDRLLENPDYRQAVLRDILEIDDDLQESEKTLEELISYKPRRKFIDLFKEAKAKNGETMVYRMMRFLDSMKLLEEAGATLPPFFTDSHFSKACPETFYWMAQHNLKNGSSIAIKKARIAIDTILQKFPGTEYAELPALILLANLERKNAESASGGEKELFLKLAYQYYKLAFDRYPGSDLAELARMGQADMSWALGDTTSAVLMYRDILQFGSHQHPSHAEATFKIGKIHFERSELEKAFPFFQATYVKYQRFPNWAAQGMLYHARSLKQLGHPADARRVIQAALQNPMIRSTTSFQELQQEL